MNVIGKAYRRLTHIKSRVSTRLLGSYESLYEWQARILPTEEAVGGGEFELMGRMELEILQREGLRSHHSLLDFGCGNGRLALQAVPYLSSGEFYGVDISKTFLRAARQRIAATNPAPTCRVEWRHQASDEIDLPDSCVDRMCAFSVFTHMEHEDMYRYLCEARRVVRPGGQFLFSCLPMTLPHAREIFLTEAAETHDARWGRVRNVTTTVEFMNTIAEMAGWRIVRWHTDGEPKSQLPECVGRQLGQSVCVLQR